MPADASPPTPGADALDDVYRGLVAERYGRDGHGWFTRQPEPRRHPREEVLLRWDGDSPEVVAERRRVLEEIAREDELEARRARRAAS